MLTCKEVKFASYLESSKLLTLDLFRLPRYEIRLPKETDSLLFLQRKYQICHDGPGSLRGCLYRLYERHRPPKYVRCCKSLSNN